MLTAKDLPLRELIAVALSANVLTLMSERRTRTITIDYVPAREAMMFLRAPADEAIEAEAPQVIPLTFTLEDAMFGGEVFVALVCGSRVVVSPFVWQNYEQLRHVTFQSG